MTTAERLAKIETNLANAISLLTEIKSNQSGHENRIRALEIKQGSFRFGGSLLFNVFIIIASIIGIINIVMVWAK